MKQIRLTKYGFISSPEDNFSDDGNYFIGYRAGNIKVSKLVSEGQVYISADSSPVDCEYLPYEVYSNLPHYHVTGDLNGVALTSITDEDLQNLYNDCLEYEREYKEALNSFTWPTKEEIISKAEERNDFYKAEYNEIINSVNVETLLKMNDYTLKTFKQYMNNLKAEIVDPDNIVKNYYGHSSSVNYIKRETKPSSWYTWVKEVLQKM